MTGGESFEAGAGQSTDATRPDDRNTTEASIKADMEPASLLSLPSELVSEVSEYLAVSLKFKSLLELRLANKSFADSVDRVLQLRAMTALGFGYVLFEGFIDRYVVASVSKSFKPWCGWPKMPWSTIVDLSELSQVPAPGSGKASRTYMLLWSCLVAASYNTGDEIWVARKPGRIQRYNFGIFRSKDDAVKACLAMFPSVGCDVVTREISEDEVTISRFDTGDEGEIWTCACTIIEPVPPNRMPAQGR
jgi:hypothetical protein